ncbi:MAG TPA: MFS transporter [Paracoccaceae bacterium]|nr:MFS transporter [Paracoccaceae bacterium]
MTDDASMRPEAGGSDGIGFGALILPMAVVMAPQTMLAAVQHGLAVLGPEITRAAGLPPEAVGLIAGLSGAGAVWFFAASAAIVEPLGSGRTLTAACLLSALAALVITTGWAPLVLLAAPFVGFAYAATAPAGSQILVEATPRRLWSSLFSIRMAGVPAGGAFAGVVAAGLAAALSWRVGLGAMALAPLACAGFLALAAKRWRGPARGRLRLAAIASPRNLATPFAVLRRSPALRRLTFASLGFAAVQGSAFTFLTTYLTDGVGLTLALAGALFATMQGASFVGRIGMGLLADRLGGPRRVLIGLGAASALGSVLLTQASAELPVWALFAGAAATGASVATWNGLFLAQIASSVPADDVGAATSASTFFTFLGYMATPICFAGLSLMIGYEASYLVAGLCVIGATLTLATGGRET